MPRRFRSSGVLTILGTGFLYLLITVAVMSFVSHRYDPRVIETVDTIFWAAIALTSGTLVLVMTQFCANMYVAKPIGDFVAGILVIANALVTLMVIGLFVDSSIGA